MVSAVEAYPFVSGAFLVTALAFAGLVAWQGRGNRTSRALALLVAAIGLDDGARGVIQAIFLAGHLHTFVGLDTNRVLVICAMPALYLHFIHLALRPSWLEVLGSPRRWLVYGAIIVPGFLGTLWPPGLLLAEPPRVFFMQYWTTLTNIAAGIIGLVAAFQHHARAEPGTLARQQARIYLWAFIVRDGSWFLWLVFATIPSTLGIGFVPTLEQFALMLMVGFLPLLFTFVALLAVGIFRFRLFDIQPRLRWTVSRSAVAAAFVAVFFVASELSAATFADRTGSTVLGILGAGILVFAIAPLMRAADRFAARVVPESTPIGQRPEKERSEIFFQQARIVWEDGALSARDRRLLDELRDRLALPATTASRLESLAARG